MAIKFEQIPARNYLILAALVAILAALVGLFAGGFSPASDSRHTVPSSVNKFADASASGTKAPARAYEAAHDEKSAFPAEMTAALNSADPAAVEQLLTRWLTQDQPGFLAYLDSLEENEGTTAWSRLIPAFQNALRKLPAEAETENLSLIVLRITERYATQNPRAALAWVRQSLLAETLDSALAIIAAELAGSSPSEAQEVVRAIQNPDARLQAVAGIASTWAARDSAAALAWAQALTDAQEKSTALAEVIDILAESEPTQAAQHLAQLRDASVLEVVSGSVAEGLAQSEPRRGMEWAESLPAGIAKDDALVGAYTGWAEKDPADAWTHCQAHHPQSTDSAESIFASWAEKDPASAARQAARITDPALAASAALGVVNGWVDADQYSTEQWVDTLPQGRPRDLASSALVDAVAETEPAEAVARARAIQDATIRSDALVSAFATWAVADQAAARAALTDLPPLERSALGPIVENVRATTVTLK